MRPPPLPHQVDVLQRVLERISAAVSEVSETPVVVFDLDGTLLDNRPRTLQILLEYSEEIRDQDPEVADALSILDSSRIHYLLTDTLRECGLTHVDVVRDVTHFWRERFYSDEFCAYDAPMEGAPEYVRACLEAGATIVYVAGRDIPGMMLGTVASLRDNGYPIAEPGVELVLKPDATMADEAFKRGIMPALGRSGFVVGFFDNEPANCNLARAVFDEAEVALMDTIKVPGAPDPDQGIDLISDFRIL